MFAATAAVLLAVAATTADYNTPTGSLSVQQGYGGLNSALWLKWTDPNTGSAYWVRYGGLSLGGETWNAQSQRLEDALALPARLTIGDSYRTYHPQIPGVSPPGSLYGLPLSNGTGSFAVRVRRLYNEYDPQTSTSVPCVRTYTGSLTVKALNPGSPTDYRRDFLLSIVENGTNDGAAVGPDPLDFQP